MAKEKYPEIKPRRKRLKVGYIRTLMFFLGRAFQAAARVDKEVKKEIEGLPDGFSFGFMVLPNGPRITMVKDQRGRLKFRGKKIPLEELDVLFRFKNIECAMRVFGFEINPSVGYAQGCVGARGELSNVMILMRCMDVIQAYLLPKRVAVDAMKRYPKWTRRRRHFNRLRIYGRVLVGI